MDMPTVIIEIPLYDVGEDGKRVPFTDAQVEEVLKVMQQKDDFCGYTINDLFVETYEVEE